jgi:hypothetical protein
MACNRNIEFSTMRKINETIRQFKQSGSRKAWTPSLTINPGCAVPAARPGRQTITGLHTQTRPAACRTQSMLIPHAPACHQAKPGLPHCSQARLHSANKQLRQAAVASMYLSI